MNSRRVVTVVTALAGAALLVWQVEAAGLEHVVAGLRQVGAGFIAILALSLLRFTLRSLAWTTLIGERVPLTRAVAATITGDAIGNVTPLSLLVSEPTKALYLGSGVPASRALAALAAETFLYSVTVALVIIAGIAVMLLTFIVPDAVRLAGLLSLAAMIGVLAAALWIVWRQPAIASAVLARVPWLSLEALVTRVRDFEVKTYGFVRQSRSRIGLVLTCELSFHLVSFLESWLTLWLITGSRPLEAFILDTVNRIINVVFRVVPFKIGVDETGAALVAQAIGVNPAAAVTMALVRKGRMFVWAAVGFALLAMRQRGNGAKGQ